MDEDFLGIGFEGMDDEEAMAYMEQIEHEINKIVKVMKRLNISFISFVRPVEDKEPGVMFQ